MSLRIAVLVDDKRLRDQLSTLLSSIGQVTAVRLCRTQSDVSGSGPHDVVVAYSSNTIRPNMPARPDAARPKLLVLLDQSRAQQQHALQIYRADGYLLRRDLTAHSLDHALTQLSAGQMPIPIQLSEALHDVVVQSGTPRLTAHERESLALAADGLTNKEIAQLTGRSPSAVKHSFETVLLKFGAPNRTAAVATAIRTGLID